MNRRRHGVGAGLGVLLLARGVAAQVEPSVPPDPGAPASLPDVVAPAPAPPAEPEAAPPVPGEPPAVPAASAPEAAPSAAFPGSPQPAEAPARAPLPSTTKQTATDPPARALARAEDPSSAPVWETASPVAADTGVQYEEPRKRDDSWGLLGPVRIGPLVGVGLPNLVNFGGLLKITRYFGAGINVGLIPTVKMANYGEAKVSYQEYDLYGRIHPFGGGFFLGTGVGYARAKGSYSKSMDIRTYADQYPGQGIPDFISSESRGSVQAMVLTPQLGYFQIFGSGFCVGADVGAQIPITSGDIELETEVSVPGASPQVRQQVVDRYVTPAQKEVYDTLESVARTPIPTFNLRIGWML